MGRGRLKHEGHEIDYIARHYPFSSEYKINSFAVFYERALSLCRDKGVCAYIVPGTILINQALSKIRKHLLVQGHIRRAVQLNYRVFREAEMGDCAILFVGKSQAKDYPVELHRYNSEKWDLDYTHDHTSSEAISGLPEWRIFMRSDAYDFLKIGGRKSVQPLGSIALFYNGIKTGDNKKFLSDRKRTSRHIPVVRGRDFERYGVAKPEVYVDFDPEALWSNTDATKLGAKSKVLIRQTGDTLTGTLDTNAVYCMDTVHFIYESQYDLRFLLGLINSKLLNAYHQFLVPEFGKAFAEVKIANLQKLPIPRIAPLDATEKTRQDQIVTKVEAMLEAKKRLAKAKTDKDKTYYENKCAALDRQIDRLVYDLYGLTEKEIQIVEQQK